VAKTWQKFDIISPVWLQILRKGPKEYEIGGEHDIDSDWVLDVKKTGNMKTKGK
jgi:chitinase domain-containing protein 1